MGKIMVIIIGLSVWGCSGHIPGCETNNEFNSKDSFAIKVDTMDNGHDYEFDFKL